MINKRLFRYFDWLTFFTILMLIGIGLTFVFSTTYTPEEPCSRFFKKQLFGALSGIALYLFCCFKDIYILITWGYLGYFFTLILLCYTMLGGMVALGGQRWISLYIIRFQPSELVKLCLPFFIAMSLTHHGPPKFLSRLMPRGAPFVFPLIMLGITSLLIMRQPDLGTALLVLFSGAIMLWVAGLPRIFFIIFASASIICAPLLWQALKPYQQKRILTLFGQGDSNKERYQIEQSKIAIGSGGIFGKGLLKGTQGQLSFLPEDHTDFIFSIICEEWGFIGALILFLLFTLLFLRLLYYTQFISGALERIIAIGMIIHPLLSVIINISMVLGMLPTVGIPLPFITYGITHLWITFISLGLAHNICMRQHLDN